MTEYKGECIFHSSIFYWLINGTSLTIPLSQHTHMRIHTHTRVCLCISVICSYTSDKMLFLNSCLLIIALEGSESGGGEKIIWGSVFQIWLDHVDSLGDVFKK